MDAAQKIAQVAAKVPESVDYAAAQANDIATQMARAFADAPLPKPAEKAPEAQPVLDFTWKKPPSASSIIEIGLEPMPEIKHNRIPEIQLEPVQETAPLPEIQLEPIPEIGLEQVRLDFSRQIPKRKPVLDLMPGLKLW